jgi:hypothetical protein
MSLKPKTVYNDRWNQQIKDIRDALLNYCKLDTLAMVKVWEKLKEYSMN